MRQKVTRLFLSAILFYMWDGYADTVFVIPSPIVGVSAFLPPILGLAWGPVGVLGVAAGAFFSHFAVSLNVVVAAVAAYLPYRLWHTFFLDESRPVFSFDSKSLIKFVFISAVTVVLTSLVTGLMTADDEIAALFEGSNLQLHSHLEYAGVLFLNDFNIAIFFGVPIFITLISCRYNFYIPSRVGIRQTKTYEANRLALLLLFGFFLALFFVLNVSGVIYDLDRMDTWLRFSGEILTVMNLTLSALSFMLIKYRHSIMTNLMMMELATIFIAAFMLGSISFVALSRTVDENADNDLQKMSVIYRERLAHAFNDTIMAVGSMTRLAADDMESYDRLKGDAAYRQSYLARAEQEFRAIAENSAGSVGYYIQLPEELGNDGFLCVRNPKKWGAILPSFTNHASDRQLNRYHNPQEQYMAKWSEPYKNEETGRYMISYVVPLEKNGQFVGLVGMDIDFDYIIHEIQRMAVYEHGVVCLLDKNGTVLYSSQPNADSVINKRGFYETETYLSTGTWLRISASAHDIYADRNNMLIHFVVVMLFIVIIVSFFSLWLAKKGIRPLILITEAARNIAAGDLNVKLPHEAKNELGVLIESIEEMVSKLEIYVYRDKLTGLRNAAAYIRKTDDLDRQTGNGQVPAYAVVVFDANFLKRINDTYGHEAGNELIRRAARNICEVFAHSPVFRIGGDEFTAILEHHDYEHRDELLTAFDEKSAADGFEVNGENLPVSVARGIGIYKEGMTYAAVFQQADEAMYRHKAELKAKMKK